MRNWIESTDSLLDSFAVKGSQEMKSGVNKTRRKVQGQRRASFFERRVLKYVFLMCVIC